MTVLQMPGHEPSGFEQVVGHVTFCVAVAVGVGAPVGAADRVGVGPLSSGAGGIVTVIEGVPSGSGVGATDGVTLSLGIGSCTL